MFPEFVFSNHDVENGYELPHRCDDGLEWCFAVFKQPFVEPLDGWVVLFRNDDRHVERFADLSATSAGGSFSSQRATIAIGGGDANEPCMHSRGD